MEAQKTNMLKYFSILIFFITYCPISIVAQYLNPGDAVEIRLICLRDTLDSKILVREDSNIHLPHIGLMNTKNKDFKILEREITENYKKLYRDPEIYVTLLFEIGIFGEVKNPGEYLLKEYDTIFDIIASAGGTTENSDLSKILVIRNESAYEIDLEDFFRENNNLNQLRINAGDKVYIPRSGGNSMDVISLVTSGLALAIAITSLLVE